MTIAAEPLVRFERVGAIARITLDRPRAINALNPQMFSEIDTALTAALESGATAVVLDGTGERGFCGGGDIKAIAAGDSRAILAQEYAVDYRLATSPVPVIAVMDGIAMGGGIGLAGHADIRLVTERSRLAMPEVRIGIVPDVGGNALLARAPGRLGEYLALTAQEMTAGDALALGFADAMIRSDRLELLRERLAAGEDASAVVAALSVPAPVSPLSAVREWWDTLADEAFGAVRVVAGTEPMSLESEHTVGGIGSGDNRNGSANYAIGFAAEADAWLAATRTLLSLLDSDGREMAVAAAQTIRAMCPTSVVVAAARVGRTRDLAYDLAAVLREDHLSLGRLAGRPDFAEGVRAQVIDKDRSPRWNPATVAEVDAAELHALFAAPAAHEPELVF